MSEVAVILINYKNYAERFLKECRDSLREQSFPKERFQVYIVDNASSEETRSFIAENYPEAVLIPRHDGNYAAANNLGIKKAMADGCSLFVNLNMDTVVDKNWLAELVQAVNAGEKTGIAQSKILLYPEKVGKINSLGNIFHFLGFGFTKNYGKKDTPNEFGSEPIGTIRGYASGCSLIIKKQVIDAIGLYDEEFYMYHDDVEFCWRAKLAGYKIVLANASLVYHKYEFKRSVKMLYYMERNRYLAVFIYYKCPTILLLLPAMIIMELGMWFFSIIRGWLGTKIKVALYFLKPKTWKHVFQARKRVKKLRVKKDKDIVKNFSGQVLFQEIDNPLLKYIGNPILNLYWQIVKKIIFW